MVELGEAFDDLYQKGFSDPQIARELNTSKYNVWLTRTRKGLPPNSKGGRAKGSLQSKDTICWDCQNARADRCPKFVADCQKDWGEFKRFIKKNWTEYKTAKKVYRWRTTAGMVEKVWNVEIVKQCKSFKADGAKEYPELLEELKENIEKLKEDKEDESIGLKVSTTDTGML